MPSGVYVRTEKTRQNLRKAHLGKPLSDSHKDKIRQSLLGRKITWGWKVGLALRGKTRKMSLKARIAMSAGRQGIPVSEWKGFKDTLNNRIRRGRPYKRWRTSIFERDDYICQLCSQRGGKLNADHIKSFSKYPKLRLDIDNGRTLCVPCHMKTDTYGGKSILIKLNDLST